MYCALTIGACACNQHLAADCLWPLPLVVCAMIAPFVAWWRSANTDRPRAATSAPLAGAGSNPSRGLRRRTFRGTGCNRVTAGTDGRHIALFRHHPVRDGGRVPGVAPTQHVLGRRTGNERRRDLLARGATPVADKTPANKIVALPSAPPPPRSPRLAAAAQYRRRRGSRELSRPIRRLMTPRLSRVRAAHSS